ncbi:MAG: iron chelate uptake ABC transporter family permease subunit [Methanomassiliicoccales archaeon]
MNTRSIDELYAQKKVKRLIIIISLIAVLFVLVILVMCVGPVKISPFTVIEILFGTNSPGPSDELYRKIVLEVRLPRVILSGLVGAALSVAGAAMQALFRNPMASPYILGISSGAAFGASLAMVLGIGMALGIYSIPLLAFVFALATIFLVYEVAKVQGRTPVETLLLTGIAVGSLFSALVSFMQYIAGEKLSTIVFWLMGGFWTSDWDKVAIAAPLILLGIVATSAFSRHLNLILMGEETATNLGLEVETFKKIILVLSSLVTAAAVSVCGIIGFVGLIIPHIMRIVVGPDHRLLLPASCIVGAIFLISVDTFARTIIEPTELPVGVITALLGVPFFLYLLRRRKRITGW